MEPVKVKLKRDTVGVSIIVAKMAYILYLVIIMILLVKFLCQTTQKILGMI